MYINKLKKKKQKQKREMKVKIYLSNAEFGYVFSLHLPKNNEHEQLQVWNCLALNLSVVILTFNYGTILLEHVKIIV